MELKEIKTIIDLMNKNNLSEFELERKDFKIRIGRGGNEKAAPAIAYPAAPLPAAPLPTAPVPTATPAEPAVKDDAPTINSPMVGTFYTSPSPDSPAYVSVGQDVDENTVVCIVEAMKVMNEIKAEMKGTIVEILAENAKPVEFGQPLFRIQPK